MDTLTPGFTLMSWMNGKLIFFILEALRFLVCRLSAESSEFVKNCFHNFFSIGEIFYMKILVDVISEKLFNDIKVREKILRDYGITEYPESSEKFIQCITSHLDQVSEINPLEHQYSNDDVFRAAVRALGSNSRKWTTFLQSEDRLKNMLGNYSASYTNEALKSGRLSEKEIKACLPGQTSGKDAKAICSWAAMLDREDSSYGIIRNIADDIRDYSLKKYNRPISDSRLPLVTVAVLSGDRIRRTPEFIKAHREKFLNGQKKLPGMGYILASEFLRNLHWTAFKPDRHIKRLFDRWCGDLINRYEDELAQLMNLFGTQNRTLKEYFSYSILGIELCPEGVPITFVDNIVWLLAAYVERKGRESSTPYIS